MRPHLTDAQLAARACRGEDWAFEELAARYAGLIGASVNGYGGNGETPEDFRQAALLGLYKAACTYDASHGTTFHTWAKRIVHSETVSHLVTARRGKHRVLSDASRFEQPVTVEGESVSLGAMIASPERTPCEHVIARERLAEQVGVVRGCSALERGVVADRLNGLTLVEAKPPGHGEKAADNALQRVRRKLAAAA